MWKMVALSSVLYVVHCLLIASSFSEGFPKDFDDSELISAITEEQKSGKNGGVFWSAGDNGDDKYGKAQKWTLESLDKAAANGMKVDSSKSHENNDSGRLMADSPLESDRYKNDSHEGSGQSEKSSEETSGEHNQTVDYSNQVQFITDINGNVTIDSANWSRSVGRWIRKVNRYLGNTRVKRQDVWSFLFPSPSGPSANSATKSGTDIGLQLKPALDLMTQGVSLLGDLYSSNMKLDTNSTAVVDQFKTQMDQLQFKLSDLGTQLNSLLDNFQKMQVPFLSAALSGLSDLTMTHPTKIETSGKNDNSLKKPAW